MIVTVATYSGNLVAVLTFPKIRNPINTFEDVLSYGGRWGVFDGEALIEQLQVSSHNKRFLMKLDCNLIYKRILIFF